VLADVGNGTEFSDVRKKRGEPHGGSYGESGRDCPAVYRRTVSGQLREALGHEQPQTIGWKGEEKLLNYLKESRGPRGEEEP